MTNPDTSADAVAKLLDGVTDGPWKYEAMGGASTVLAYKLPPRNDARAEHPYGYGGDKFCLGYPFIDDVSKSTRMDFVLFGHADASFIAAARQLVPALSRDLEAMRDKRDAALARVALFKAALESIADSKRLASHGDPVVLRDFARAALSQEGGE